MIDKLSVMGFGVVMRWTCDGCGAARTILNGRFEQEGRHFCVDCGKPLFVRARTDRTSSFHCVALHFGEDEDKICELTPEEHVELLSVTSVQTLDRLEGQRILTNLAVVEHALDCGCEACQYVNGVESAQIQVDGRYLQYGVRSDTLHLMQVMSDYERLIRKDNIRDYKDGRGARCPSIHFFPSAEGEIRAARCLKRDEHVELHRGVRTVWSDEHDPRRVRVEHDVNRNTT
jgi:hypothetical protein